MNDTFFGSRVVWGRNAPAPKIFGFTLAFKSALEIFGEELHGSGSKLCWRWELERSPIDVLMESIPGTWSKFLEAPRPCY